MSATSCFQCRRPVEICVCQKVYDQNGENPETPTEKMIRESNEQIERLSGKGTITLTADEGKRLSGLVVCLTNIRANMLAKYLDGSIMSVPEWETLKSIDHALGQVANIKLGDAT